MAAGISTDISRILPPGRKYAVLSRLFDQVVKVQRINGFYGVLKEKLHNPYMPGILGIIGWAQILERPEKDLYTLQAVLCLELVIYGTQVIANRELRIVAPNSLSDSLRQLARPIQLRRYGHREPGPKENRNLAIHQKVDSNFFDERMCQF